MAIEQEKATNPYVPQTTLWELWDKMQKLGVVWSLDALTGMVSVRVDNEDVRLGVVDKILSVSVIELDYTILVIQNYIADCRKWGKFRE